MKSFDVWFKKTMPNTHKGVGKEKIETFAYQTTEDAWNHQQQKIDELQKRIDDALKELELLNYFRTGNSDNAIKILKGEQK